MDIINEITGQIPPEKEVEKQKTKIVAPAELTEEQKQRIIDWWNNAPKDSPLLLRDAVQAAFGPEVDGRNRALSKLVKVFLASRQIKAESTYGYKPVGNIELTPEQKEYLTNNISKMTPMEMARILFNDSKLSALDRRFIVTNNFCSTLNNAIKYTPVNEARVGNYRPPKNITEAANVVNRFIRNGIDVELTKKDKKIQECLNGLVKFCHSSHFILIIDNFTSDIDKNLFESRFVSYVWDKPDLTEEEVDAYIQLCSNIVKHAQLERQIDNLKNRIDEQMDEKDGKVYMNMVEMINNLNKTITDNEVRQDKLRKELTGLRSERIDLKTKENQSVLQLVEAWRDEEKRSLMIKLANKRKEEVKDEIKKQEDFDDLLSQLYGIDKMAFE